jgi:hypothetical protein
MELEHYWKDSTTDDGKHLMGSGKGWVTNTEPTNAPSGEALDTTDTGQFWFNDTNGEFFIYTGANFVPITKFDTNIEITGTLTVAGALTVTSNVEITGSTTVARAVTVTSNLDVTGTLTVAGAVDFDSNLNVAGIVTVESALNLNANLSFTDDHADRDHTVDVVSVSWSSGTTRNELYDLFHTHLSGISDGESVGCFGYVNTDCISMVRKSSGDYFGSGLSTSGSFQDLFQAVDGSGTTLPASETPGYVVFVPHT